MSPRERLQIPVGRQPSVDVAHSQNVLRSVFSRNVRLNPHGISLPLRGRGTALAGDEVLPLRKVKTARYLVRTIYVSVCGTISSAEVSGYAASLADTFLCCLRQQRKVRKTCVKRFYRTIWSGFTLSF